MGIEEVSEPTGAVRPLPGPGIAEIALSALRWGGHHSELRRHIEVVVSVGVLLGRGRGGGGLLDHVLLVVGVLLQGGVRPTTTATAVTPAATTPQEVEE